MKRREKVEDGDDHDWLVEAERVSPGLTAVTVAVTVAATKRIKAKNRKILRYMLCFVLVFLMMFFVSMGIM